MNPLNRYDIETLKRISRNQVRRRQGNIQSSLPPDYPAKLQFEEVRKQVIIVDQDFGKFDIQHYELLYYPDGRNDQFTIRFNGDQLFKNRRGRIVVNYTMNPLTLGLTGVFALAASKNFRIRRSYI